MKCTICEKGDLTEKYEETYYGGFYYSVCDFCLSELANEEQLSINKKIFNETVRGGVEE